MPRVTIRRNRASTRLARHLAARRALVDRVGATTPVRFLRRLDLWGDDGLHETGWRDRFEFSFDESVADVGVEEVAQVEGGHIIVHAVAPVGARRDDVRRQASTEVSAVSAIEAADSSRSMSTEDDRPAVPVSAHGPLLAVQADPASIGAASSVAGEEVAPEPGDALSVSQSVVSPAVPDNSAEQTSDPTNRSLPPMAAWVDGSMSSPSAMAGASRPATAIPSEDAPIAADAERREETVPPVQLEESVALSSNTLAASFTETPRVPGEGTSRLPVATQRLRRSHVEELLSEPTRSVIEHGTADAPASVPPAADHRHSSAASASRRPSPSNEPSRPRAADALFQPTDTVDMSPAAWAARLARSLRRTAEPRPTTPSPNPAIRETPAQPRAARTAARPTGARRQDEPVRLSEHTRRFLKPLVGIDPASVPIWQGPRSNAVAAAHRADGMAVGGEAIIVRASVDEETPEGLGLLAHELTHIARHRQPRFVPPIARRSSAGMPAHQDEETMARRVEARVIGVARNAAMSHRSRSQAVDVPASTVKTFPAASSRTDDPSGEPERPVSLPAGVVPMNQRQDSMNPSWRTLQDWGGLPAPWEAMPAWIASSSRSEPGSTTTTSPASPAAVVARQPAAAAPPASGSAPPAPAAGHSLHLAEEGRTLEQPTAATGAAGERARAVAPDLDVLARQVYAVLKRRLEAEMRREQMF